MSCLTRYSVSLTTLLLVAFASINAHAAEPSEQQLARWLKRFPAADANGDGRLTVQEAEAFRSKLLSPQPAKPKTEIDAGAPREPKINPGWDAARFPEHAVSHRSPEEIKALFAKVQRGGRDAIASYGKPADGSFRIVATGHSFMAPAFKSFPPIAKAAGLKQPPLVTHTGGGMTGSARYKWEQENGIFQFDKKPVPKLLAAISNAEWDAMLWGPYYHDRAVYYSCWIDFCLKYNPKMKFYLMDAWPQIDQLPEMPTSEDSFTPEILDKMSDVKHKVYGEIIDTLNKKYPGKVFVLPTCNAMVIAAKRYSKGELPGVEGIHTLVGKKQRSIWRDRIGHLGPGFGNLEGYVFYATLYGRSPALIEGDVEFGGLEEYPSRELDRVFREIAWQAVIAHPDSGVTDANGNGIADERE